ncbi:Oxysterol-binding protein-domain-containing protein [Suillus clintonianus]|uniref:Oxysterol-binding protein-domain-containing protein n=1 Tax=Suillus clintonianus TaxID=1904413 RepID=UPI001B882852|nr:Oxysterol-binding protein-domain-containing protein [Suillus clintonianus]KAG2155379.1 Oxysterol-binding protein-domain-containing protein [Suillus clintonianus]
MSSARQSFPLSINTGQNSGVTVVCEGWVLKKRRKKMQGFARRYFVLDQSGSLSYSIDPKRPIRDKIFLPHAALSTAVGRKDIHVDSSNATFHIKCLTADDFNTWLTAIRQFVLPEGRRSLAGKTTPRLSQSQFNRSGVIAEDIGSTISELEAAFAALQSESTHERSHPSLKSKSEKDKHHHLPFNMFKKSHQINEDGTLPKSNLDSPSNLRFQQIDTALAALKSQHAALLKSLQAHDGTAPPTARGSPLPPTTEEKEEEPLSASRFNTSLTRRSNLAISMSSLSDTTPNEWFDAEEDVGEEFFLDVPTPDEEMELFVPQSDTSSLNQTESGDEEKPSTPPAHDLDPSVNARQVVRRTRLPSGPVGDEGSLFAILKNNVGKDLSTIAFPVSFNEPLTLLQRTAEELEYFNLLHQATEANDPTQRLCFVAAFAVSGYAHTRYRTGRKGFNPMLAETFEDVRMKFLAEKVSHNPVIIAYHAEGKGWELNATSAGKTKFWGKSLEVIPLGTTRLKIGNDEYEWNKPSSFMRNLMMGTKYLEHCGKMTIENTTSGATCVLDFKQSGYWGASNEVSGVVLSSSREVSARIEGKWDEQIAQALDSSYLHVLWRITPFEKESPQYYGFTAFGMTLNEITSDLEGRLPPTDSRFRPDVRALEHGDDNEAEAQKTRVEEMQRDRRRRGADRAPRWFKQDGEEWTYAGGYWEARARGWKDTPVEPLW